MRSSRRSQNPARVVGVVGVVGTVLLGGLFLFASGLAARGTPLSPGAIVPAPSVPVLSVRRTPTVLSVVSRTGRVARAVRGVADQVGTSGCLTVSWKGSSLLASNAETPLIPASTLKIVTGSVALEVLGPSHVFETSVHATVDAQGTAPTLFMVGGGDPMLVTAEYPPTEKYPTTAGTSLEALADSVVAAGVKVVSNGVVGVDSRYDSERYVAQWSQEIRDTEAGPLGALMVNDGTVVGQQARPAEPAVSAANELIRLLRARGVTVNGSGVRGELPEGTASIASVRSAPLQAIVADMLARSDDNTAELLLKEIGRSRKGTGSTLNGSLVEAEVLTDRGQATGVQIVDGSGLARENRLSCTTLMAVLSREVAAFPSMLAVAGTSGTLREWFNDSAARGRLVGKTGTLSGVKALAGYVIVDGDDPVVFAMVLNRPGVDQPGAHRAIWNSLADALARAKGTPRPEQLAP